MDAPKKIYYPGVDGRPCAAITKLGVPCQSNAQPGSAYCASHARLKDPLRADKTNPGSAA